jgi:hypothetical protein
MTRWELEWMMEIAAAYLDAQEGKSIFVPGSRVDISPEG